MPENFASSAGGATGRRKMNVNTKRRINQADHHLYVVRLEEIKPEHWRYNLLWDRVVDPDTVAEPCSAEFSSQPARTRKNLKTKQGADPKTIRSTRGWRCGGRAGNAKGAASLGGAAAGERGWVEPPSAGGLEKEAAAGGGASSAPPGACVLAGKQGFVLAVGSGGDSGRHSSQGFFGQEWAGWWPLQRMQWCRPLGARLPNFGLCAAAGHVETPAAALARLSPR